ncbi:50S ribosomal protein L22 [Limihaloglobus sulfuriphilus]|uniref:Large ribosomal subunit protein uL22 n=1 Tax=Limihaloglobus sulfuriphilus TaxID=1851148 RepID=A0A1Q2MH82_9BACT|nr:50S ribosomal protein L22 [Limihaloglobus sulfuriphilus]AQQ72051.1 50S ribosomal protein L22 [Limihaloglobus sulfuriphilus]
MLNGIKLKEYARTNGVSSQELAEMVRIGGRTEKQALAAVKNWQNCLYKPMPTSEDIEALARGLHVSVNAISQWSSRHKYAPTSPTKARLVARLIAGRTAQDALDTLKFTPKRSAEMVRKVLETAISNADEQEADVERLYVSEARIDGAGRRIGTKGWIAKDRGRAHPIRKQASHIIVTVAEN